MLRVPERLKPAYRAVIIGGGGAVGTAALLDTQQR